MATDSSPELSAETEDELEEDESASSTGAWWALGLRLNGLVAIKLEVERHIPCITHWRILFFLFLRDALVELSLGWLLS